MNISYIYNYYFSGLFGMHTWGNYRNPDTWELSYFVSSFNHRTEWRKNDFWYWLCVSLTIFPN
ncbi:MAG: hypothetical protein LBV69_11985 [Bacteroidales bacterium]|jgi:hypothetical protein|nr:hypothetical protein [Bacteroidales bacterium]